MAINVTVTKNSGETATSAIRRFTKRVQQSGVLQRVRSIRFHERSASDYKRKQQALRTLAKRKQYEHKLKMGKISATAGRGGRRR